MCYQMWFMKYGRYTIDTNQRWAAAVQRPYVKHYIRTTNFTIAYFKNI